MVKDPIEYPWSSHSANAAGKPVASLTPHGEYLALGSDDEKRQAAYRGLFATELDQQLLRDIRISTHGGYAIGSNRFREEIESALRLRATPRGPGRPAAEAGVQLSLSRRYRDTAPFGRRRRFVSMIASTSISTSISGIARQATPISVLVGYGALKNLNRSSMAAK